MVENELVKKGRAIHDRVMVLDAHVDFSPSHLTGPTNYTQRLETRLNLPKMIEGGLDAVFLIEFVGQTKETQRPDAFAEAGYARAYAAAVEKFDAVHHFVREIASDDIALALTAADVHRIHAQGKKVALIGVENGYPM